MPLPKISAFWNSNNLRTARAMSARAFGSSMGRSYGRWMAMGAGLGAVRGLADNITGNDRVSVLGGAIQGALTGGALRGMRSMWTGDIATRMGRLRRARTFRAGRSARAAMGSSWGYMGGDIY